MYCGVYNVDYYLQSARRQIDPYYVRIPLDRIKCYCDRHLYMSMSNSHKNPGRLYLKCPKRYCDFFQWVDTPPRGKTRAHLESPSREGYPRPPHLFQPQPREELQRVDKLCKKRSREFQDQERRYSEKLRNGTFEERERERVYKKELKRSGGMVNDSMERRRYGLDPPLGPFEGNWDQAEFTPKERVYLEQRGLE